MSPAHRRSSILAAWVFGITLATFAGACSSSRSSPPSCSAADTYAQQTNETFKQWSFAQFDQPSRRPALVRQMLRLEAREAALVSSVRSYLLRHGAYQGGDDCLATLARSEHVALFFKKAYGDEVVAWETLVRFYPTSSYEGEARGWLAKLTG